MSNHHLIITINISLNLNPSFNKILKLFQTFLLLIKKTYFDEMKTLIIRFKLYRTTK